jgi:CNT family concentrative nucleoside transporter
MGHIEAFARDGAVFVYGGIAVMNGDKASDYRGGGFVFAFNVLATIVLVCALIALLYHLGIMQRVVSTIARGMNAVMRVSGAETLSNVASAFVGQVEAQMMISAVSEGHDAERAACVDERQPRVHRRRHPDRLREHGRRGRHGPRAEADHREHHGRAGALVIAKIVWPETEEKPDDGARQARREERVLQRDRRDLARRGRRFQIA